MEPHDELRKQMFVMKKENNKKYKKEILGKFDPLAFKKC